MSTSFHLFERVGVELEYMLVRRDTLAVLPAADRVLRAAAGHDAADVEVGTLTWSNELVLHLIELKTTEPAIGLDGLSPSFQDDVRRVNTLLEPLGGQLMPGGMHPWMDPHTEARLWPHAGAEIYAAFHRIFDCRSHGWANLQASHLNLPFYDDEEFGRLHAAIRLLLPILPALTASSPVADGHITGVLDTRLEVYRSNARKVPAITGDVIPEPVYTRREYEEHILARIYRDLGAHDPEGILRYEWANARGAIARFDRNTIEIRLLDIQECPQADLAVLSLVVAVLRHMVAQRWTSCSEQSRWEVAPLARILLDTIVTADQTVLTDTDYLRQLGLERVKRCTAGDVWQHLYESVLTPAERNSEFLAPLRTILKDGCLARRLVRALGPEPDRAQMAATYRDLCACLAEGRMFQI